MKASKTSEKELQGLRNVAEITDQAIQDHLAWLNSKEHADLIRWLKAA